MKYKIGDKVRIKSLDWYNENMDKNGIVELSTHVFTPGMSQFCGKVMTIEDVFEDIDDNVVYYMEEIDYDWTDEMIEGLVEEEVGLVDNFSSRWVNEFNLPDGYQFVDENGNVINATKIVLEKKKKEYPKNFKECFEIIYGKYSPYSKPIVITNIGYKGELITNFQKLLFYRDAYWKIAGEEMGLGKPWEPENPAKHYIYTIENNGNEIIKNTITDKFKNRILAFPTEEMRNAFCENFKELIERCKELL